MKNKEIKKTILIINNKKTFNNNKSIKNHNINSLKIIININIFITIKNIKIIDLCILLEIYNRKIKIIRIKLQTITIKI